MEIPTNASLYVGELDPTVTEAQLFELFNYIGPVASIRVCRDAVTRRSLGYAYVNYHSQADGERALNELNYTQLKGKSIRIMWSQRDPSLRRSGNGNIFIKNLDETIDNKMLHDTFSAFGHILSCKVVADDGGSKGYGYVHFAEQEAAEAAIKAVNGMLLNDKKVFVGFHVSKKERLSKLDEIKANFTNVYVKNLDETISDEEFRSMFEAFGPVTSAVVTRDENGKSKGFGFVNFQNTEDAHVAVESLHEKEIKGKALFVGRAQKKAEREEELKRQYEKIREEKLSKYQGVNLYIKNLDESVTDEILRQEFSAYGTITSCRVMIDDKTGISKGFGFVCFSSPDEATKAVTETNGKMIANKPIYVALAQRKEVRRQLLATQMQQRAQMRLTQPPGVGVPGYPGAPMFYPGPVPPQAAGRGGVFFQQPMVRPRFPPQQNGPVPLMPQQFGAVPVQTPRPQSASATGRPARPPRPVPQSANGRGRGQFKYTSNVRNAPPQKSKLNASTLASLDIDEQRRLLGEALYPLVQAHHSQHAGKITGMLLDMDHSELLFLLETPDALKSKVDEAYEALEEHMREQQH